MNLPKKLYFDYTFLPGLVKFDTIYAVDKMISYLKEVGLEMTKVVWPERKDVIKLTLIVFIISGIIGAYIGILDLAFTQLFERLLSI